MELVDRLRELARNLYWTWHPELIGIFRDLDHELWREVNHNPVEFLSRLSSDLVEERASQLALEARISQAFHQMHDYLEAQGTWGAWHAGPLRARPVAYFSAEFGLHESLPLYSGGLGVLAGDHLKSASDLDVPLVAVGLFYAQGYFSQRLDESGWQHEEYAFSEVDKLPLDRAMDDDGRQISVGVPTRSSEIRAQIWTAQVGRSRLILLDTNVDGNNDEDRGLTSQLYGGDQRVRIRQELVLGVGGFRALQAMGIFPGVIHMNEGHSAFVALELARTLMERDGRSFEDVREQTETMSVFTTHTPVEAGHDRFPADLVEETLGPLREQLGISQDTCLALGRVQWDNQDEPFCMTVLGLRMAQWRNAVSARHARVSRAMWQDIWPALPLDIVPIGHITNGVHVASWLGLPMVPLYERVLGADWQERMHESETWAAIDELDDAEFWEQHQILKAHLIDYVCRSLQLQCKRRAKDDSQPEQPPGLDPDTLTIGFARRFASYKRADLLLQDPDRLADLVNNPERPIQILYAGKAHPGNEAGKRLIQRIFELMHEDRFRGKILFLEDHDMNVGRHLVQGADVWLNTPRRPREACGTSGQKAVLNGGLNLSVLDGWWAEAYDGSNGFAIGRGGEHVDNDRQDRLDADALYNVLGNQVVPLYYDRNDKGVPWGWVRMQKNAIRSLAWRFSSRRMLRDYAIRCYLPAAGAATSASL